MQLHSFNGISVSQGVAMDVMIQAMNMEARANPGATLDDLSWTALIDWTAGKGQAKIIRANGEQETKSFSESRLSGRARMNSVLLLSKGDTVQLMPENGASFTVAVGNDAISVEPGLVSRPQLISDPRPTDSEEQLAVRRWLAKGNLGTSSKTMSHVLYGIPEDMDTSSYDGPHDPSDFRRCMEFIEQVPQARTRVGELAQVKGWEKIAPSFDELEALYLKETAQDTGKAPQLYSRMRALREPSPPRSAKP